MLGSSRAVLLVLSAFYIGLGFSLPTPDVLRRGDTAVVARQNAAQQQAVTVQTQDTVQTCVVATAVTFESC